MPKYIVEGEVIIKRKFRREVSAMSKDMAIKHVSRIFSNASSILIDAQQDEIILIENLSSKRNRKKLEKRGCLYIPYKQKAKFIINAKRNIQ